MLFWWWQLLVMTTWLGPVKSLPFIHCTHHSSSDSTASLSIAPIVSMTSLSIAPLVSLASLSINRKATWQAHRPIQSVYDLTSALTCSTWLRPDKRTNLFNLTTTWQAHRLDRSVSDLVDPSRVPSRAPEVKCFDYDLTVWCYFSGLRIGFVGLISFF